MPEQTSDLSKTPKLNATDCATPEAHKLYTVCLVCNSWRLPSETTAQTIEDNPEQTKQKTNPTAIDVGHFGFGC